MLAARWHARRDVRVEQVPDPHEPMPGWMRIDVEACGICGTDVEEYVNGPLIIPAGTPNPISGQMAPLVLGHESVGVVSAVGPDVSVPVGTRVAVEGNRFCGTCFWCERREYALCPSLCALGLMADGGLAQHLLAPAYMCIPVAEHIPADHAALAEPLSVAVRATRRGGVDPASTVGIVGAGTIGLLLVQTARQAGARSVVVVERHPERRRLALQLGADLAVEPAEAAAAALDSTGGIGLDVVFEAAGSAAAAAAAARLTRRGGRCVLLGVFAELAGIDMVDLLLGEKTLLTSLSHVYDVDFAGAVALIENGQVAIEPLITDRIALADLVTAGLQPLIDAPGDHLKILVHP